jgi:tetratricopeptide (TPR) repeat protein
MIIFQPINVWIGVLLGLWSLNKSHCVGDGPIKTLHNLLRGIRKDGLASIKQARPKVLFEYLRLPPNAIHITARSQLRRLYCTMNMHYQVAVEENNLGVAYLEAGDLRSALERFSIALKFTMGDLEPLPPSGRETPSEVPIVTHPDLQISSLDSNESGEPPVTTRPKPRDISAPQEKITMPTAPFAYCRGINLISSIIIFNLSIIYHLKGLEGRSMSVMRLRKAKSLYLKAHNLLVDAGVPMRATSNPVIDMLSMALYNNLAHVTFELQAYDESRRFFDKLVRFALSVVPARYGDAYVGSLLDQQKSNFLLNAIILQIPMLAAAA